MTTTVKKIPDGFQTVNAYLVVDDAEKEVAFVKQAFDAKEIHRSNDADGRLLHAGISIGTSHVMIGQARKEQGGRPATIYMYVEDADTTFRAAIAAGARSLAEPQDQFYGDRSGGVEDPCGTQWWIATHVEDVSHEEEDRRFAAMGNKH